MILVSGKDSSMTLNKVWVTLCTCALSRGIILDLLPKQHLRSFIKSCRRFISRGGCPSNVLSDSGENFRTFDMVALWVLIGKQIYHLHHGRKDSLSNY